MRAKKKRGRSEKRKGKGKKDRSYKSRRELGIKEEEVEKKRGEKRSDERRRELGIKEEDKSRCHVLNLKEIFFLMYLWIETLEHFCRLL